MPDAAPPFAPVRATFICPSLLALSARAALGGTREALLGAVMAVRLVTGLRLPFPLPLATRIARADAARAWLGALAVPAKTRTALLRAFTTSAGPDLDSAADALAAVTDVTAPHLDRSARSELIRLVERLRAESLQLAGPRERPVE